MARIYDCLVVGGGIAGLTSTAYLTKYGYDVLLCEQQPKVGGLIGTFQRDGFTFDQGIRAFENSGILFPMLRAFNIELETVKNPVKLGIIDDFVDISDDNFLENYEKMLIKYFPEESDGIKKIINKIRIVIKQMDVLYEIDNPIFIEGKYELNYVFKTLLPWLRRYKKSMKDAKEFQIGVGSYLRQFTSNQSLIDMIAQHFFEKTPAFFALSYFGFYREYQYPIGGTGVLIDKLKSYIELSGTVISTDTTISSIDYDKKVALTSDGTEIHYKNLIWAANQKSFYESLKTIPNKKTYELKKTVQKSRGSDSVLTINLGTTYDIEQLSSLLGPHSFYTAHKNGITFLGSFENYDDKDLYVKEFLKYTTYEISIPKLRDPKLAPVNQVGLIISTLFSYDLVKYYKDINKLNHLKEMVMIEIIHILETNLLPNLNKSILLKNISTPLTIEQFTSNLDGAITGWSYASENMPSITDFTYITKSVYTPLKHIYQCGQWTFSPAGMPTSVLTGKVAAFKIIKGKYKK